MKINELLEELYSYSLHSIKLGLDNIREICEELGNPQNDYKIIHIAGTNGKGSTSTTIEYGLLENGNTVGKYTSPHIIKFNERIRVNGIEITDEEIGFYYSLVKEAVSRLGIKPTFFEVTTAMMFKFFSDKKVEYAVLEVGLGGKYDATNIADADIAVITNVSMDHTEFLGNNLYKIACEKAGIIKKKSQVIVGSQNPEFIKAISEKTTEYIDVIKKYGDKNYDLDFNSFKTDIHIAGKTFKFSLFGDYQYFNFLCAYEVLKMLNISDEMIMLAAEKVVWPCRFEVINKEKVIIMDGAHNSDGMRNLKDILMKGYCPKDITTIVSILKDKDIESMSKEIEKFSGHIILTSLQENVRGLTGKELEPYFIEGNRDIAVEDDIKKAYGIALKKKSKVIVICGSFYLLSKFKEEVLNEYGI